MRKKIFLMLLAAWMSSGVVRAQQSNQSGLILNVGKGILETKAISSFQGKANVDYQSAFSIGYRFRLHPKVISPFFIDLDTSVGIKSWHSAYRTTLNQPPVFEASSQYYFVSTGANFNYPIYKGLHVGLGLDPTYYFFQEGEQSKDHFDVPIVAKIGYKFRYFEIGAVYKHSLINTLKTDYLSSGQFRDWQISLWIPF